MSKDHSSAKALPDALGVPYVRLSREGFPALSSAILAGYSTGVYDDLAKTASKPTHTASRLEPETRNHEIYQAWAAEHVRLLENSKPHFDALAAIGEHLPTDTPH